MADSELDLMQVQFGKETVWGTLVDPTAKMMGVETCEITPLHESEHIPEMRATLTPAYNAIVNRFTGEASIDGTLLYEDICYYLDSLLGIATPTGTGPYTYSYVGPGVKPTPRMISLVKGSTEGVYGLAGGLVNTLEMTFEPNAPAAFSAGLIGEDVEVDAIAALSDRVVNICHGNQVVIYIDDFAVAAGTTEYTGVKASASISLDLARTPKMGLGSLSPVGWKQAKADPSGTVPRIRR